jgi:hypothetical protein
LNQSTSPSFSRRNPSFSPVSSLSFKSWLSKQDPVDLINPLNRKGIDQSGPPNHL